MTLTIIASEIKNDIIVVGFGDGKTWSKKALLGLERTSDELAVMLESFVSSLEKQGDIVSIETAWVSSVVPFVTEKIISAVDKVFNIKMRSIGAGVKTGLKIRADNPIEIGSNIICASVASIAKYGNSTAVVDFGVAIVISVVNKNGELVSASIVPGLKTAIKALKANAVQLPEIKLEKPKCVLGKNTIEAIQVGLFIGYGGLIKRLIEKLENELGYPLTVVGSGDSIGKQILCDEGFTNFEPNLVLDGISIISEKNKY